MKTETEKAVFAKITPGCKSEVRPLYDCADYQEFVRQQKEKGLVRKCWKNLPQMWEEHLKWVEGFERALNKFANQTDAPF